MTSVKSGLKLLGTDVRLLPFIENIVKTTTEAMFDGSRLANACVVYACEKELPLPDIADQTFWRHCLARVSLTSRDRHRTTPVESSDPLINLAFHEVYLPQQKPDRQWADARGMGHSLTDCALTLKTAACNMVASTFHKRLFQAIVRNACADAWIVDATKPFTNWPKQRRNALFRVALRNATRAAGADAEPLDSDDAAVQRVYDGVSRVIEDWRNSHPAACGEKGCRDPQMITSKNIGACFAWMCDLRDHLLHTHHDLGNGVFGVEGDTSMFKKGCLKSFAMLPYASPRAKHIAISPTTLFGILRDAGMLAEGTEFEDTKMKDVTSNPDPYFRAAFRNLDKVIRNGYEFDNFIRTDGYSVSVTMSREKRVEVDQQQMGYRPGRGYVQVERTDTRCITPPSVPQPGQRLVGIDPGRRDMVCCKVACFDQNGFNAEETLKQGEDIKMSTKRHVYESRRGVNTKKMQRAMRNVTIQHAANPGVAPARNSTLDEELQCKYSGKVLFRPDFEDFLRDEAAIRDEWLEVHMRRCARRWRFDTYVKRDRSLDRLCQKICGKQRGGPPTLVAFGAANACSTGYGYAPAPQKRLRHRLATVHGARVTLIDEFHTSQRCCVCHAQLDKVFGKPYRFRDQAEQRDLFGVRRCSGECRTSHGKRLYLHRDLNSAVNMITIYMNLANAGGRPQAFARSNNGA